jgi:RNA polymerase sigma factor (sigma-70 family)
MLLEAPEQSEGRIVDETKVERCVEALVADHLRQGGHLTQDDFQKVVDRRRLAADEVLETYRRLGDDHAIAVERSGQPERRQPRRPSPSDSLSMLLADICQYRLLTAKDEVRLARRIRAGEVAADRLVGGLSDDTLWEIVENGLDAKNQMILANMRLVVDWAVRYQRSSKLELLDLIQEGVLGLTRAVEKFDHTRGYKFSTYAVWWIRQSIQRAMLNKGRMIRIPVHVHEELRSVARSRALLSRELGRLPTAREVADHAAMQHTRVEFLFDIEADAVSLDRPLAADQDLTLGDTIADFGEDPAEAAVEADLCARVAAVMDSLTPRDRRIIEMRFGFATDGEHTLEEVGEALGVTRERVRQIQNKLIEEVLPPIARATGLDGDY